MAKKRPDGRKRPDGEKRPDGALPPVYRGRGPRSGEGVQKQRYENLGKWVYILISDCGEVVKNTHSMQTTHYSLLPLLAPPHRRAVPSPYKQGESTMRNIFAHYYLLKSPPTPTNKLLTSLYLLYNLCYFMNYTLEFL